MNWNQTGMPSALVSRLGQKRELSEFKMVLKDAQNHVLQPVDVESMAEELAQAVSSEKSVPPEGSDHSRSVWGAVVRRAFVLI